MKALNSLLVTLIAVGVAACSSTLFDSQVAEEPPTSILSEESLLALEGDPVTRDELVQVLTGLFGDSREPRYRPLAEWSDVGFDPSRSPFEAPRSGLDLELLRQDNREAWKDVLAAIDASEYERIGPFRNRPSMSRAWSDLRDERDAFDEEEFRTVATAFFVERYPDLSDARELFGVYCFRCHGAQGGGNGPMSQRLIPRPRDYRRGIFKFAAVESGSKPRREDLLRTLLHGLPGSAMPSFRSLPATELHALIDYVRLLAIRGETESILLADYLERNINPEEAADEIYELVWQRWLEAPENAREVDAPEPVVTLERWQLGRDVFHDDARGGCVRCHGEEGRGDGPNALRVEADGRRFSLLKDEWDHFIRPRDLTTGIFRGGSDREDIYLRVFCGIPGTPMPSTGTSANSAGGPLIDEEEYWALVDYVLSLSGQGSLREFGPETANDSTPTPNPSAP